MTAMETNTEPQKYQSARRLSQQVMPLKYREIKSSSGKSRRDKKYHKYHAG
jgi:hypothetical protein